MKRLLVLLILATSSLGLFAQAQSKFFPESHKDIFIGMHWDAVILFRNGNLTASKAMSGYPQLVEQPKIDTLINHTRFLFTPDSILYEVIIEYKSHFSLFHYMTDFYGPPNIDSQEWLLPIDGGRELYIWEFQNRWCIADGEIYQ